MNRGEQVRTSKLKRDGRKNVHLAQASMWEGFLPQDGGVVLEC